MEIRAQELCYLSHAPGLLESTLKRTSTDKIFKINWQNHEIIAPARDQGECNAAWAYSAIGVIESHLWRWFPEHKGKELSVQQLIDCDTTNNGCRGGYMRTAYDFLISERMGIMFMEDYQTTGTRGECQYEDGDNLVHLYGYTKVPQSEEEMKEYLQFGPLAAAMVTEGLKNYQGGIIDGSKCKREYQRLSHAVVIIGYDEEVDAATNTLTPYWIVKNSWGPNWGENGTFRLKYGVDACGIAEDVSAPILEHTVATET